LKGAEVELDGCKVCELFGGPHEEHAGWHGAGVGRPATLPSAQAIRERVRIENDYRPPTPESDEELDGFIDAMSQPVTGEIVESVWDPTGSGKAQGLFQPIPPRHYDHIHEEPYLRGERSRLDDDRARALAEEVPAGYVRAPQSERGYVPIEPTQDEVDRLLTDALRMAYVGQTVRLTVLDTGTGERATFSVIKRSDPDAEAERRDRIRELESKIRNDLQEGELE
jgi:hypothetical protein